MVYKIVIPVSLHYQKMPRILHYTSVSIPKILHTYVGEEELRFPTYVFRIFVNTQYTKETYGRS